MENTLRIRSAYDTRNRRATHSLCGGIGGACPKLGAMSYGGPAIMDLTRAEIQERRGWLGKEHFFEGLALIAGGGTGLLLGSR